MRDDDFATEQPRRRGSGRPFPKGRSGNPAGRPRGTRNNPLESGRKLLSRNSRPLIEKAIERALTGDAAALRLCLDRLLPRVREGAVSLALPPVRNAADILPMTTAVAAALARGEISPNEAGALGRFVEALVRALETSEFERRLRALQAANDAPGS